MALGMAVSLGHAVAGPGDWGGRVEGTVRFVDRQLNLIELDNGTDYYTTDTRLIANIREGMKVEVEYAPADDNRRLINTIEPVEDGTSASGATSSR